VRKGRYDFSIFLIDAVGFVGGDEEKGRMCREKEKGGRYGRC